MSVKRNSSQTLMNLNANIETDLEKIERFGKIKEDENFEFRIFLKQQDPRRVDKIVHKLNREISEKIDCTSCGNCCTKLKPNVTDQDIEKLSACLKISPEKIRNDYTVSEGSEQMFKNLPCSFLKRKKCTVYDDGPDDCRSYPHLHKADFTSRLFQVIANYSVCPIVFNVFERLKHELRFK